MRTELFAYSLSDGRPEGTAPRQYRFRDEIEISDIEAIAPLGPDRFAVFGSHSRNSTCDAKGARRRFVIVSAHSGDLRAERAVVQSRKVKCSRIFEGIADQETVQAICQAVERAETQADAIDRAFDESDGGDEAQARAVADCNKAAPFNVEGAFADTRGDDSRIWVGLRSPLVTAADGRKLAVLLRLRDSKSFVFDRAALLDLGGRGIREATVDGGLIWGIAGPAADSAQRFVLWRMAVTDLESGQTHQPEIVRSVPTSSEGLWIHDGIAHLLIDGDQGSSGTKCDAPARYWTTGLESESQ